MYTAWIFCIKAACSEVFANYPVTWCYLFGSYAKGTATEQSDVDLAVSDGVEGMRFYGMVEALKTSLRKNVDVLTKAGIQNGILTPEVLEA